MDRDSLNGRVATCTRAPTTRTNVMAMASYFGLMAPSTKVSGNTECNTATANYGCPMANKKKASSKTTFSSV